MSELHLFDFDGTLFRSPEEPDWWTGKNWWGESPSMDTPCVPTKPGADWWINSTVAAAKKSISDPNVWSVLMTGRSERSFARYRVPELLKMRGLKFDQVILAPAMGAAKAYKLAATRKLLGRHPQVDVVHVWEDNSQNLSALADFVRKTGRRCEEHLVKVPPHSVVCTEEGVQRDPTLNRVAARWFYRVANEPLRGGRE